MDRNIERLCLVARKLGPLRERVVFLGGATTSLLVTDPAAPAPRPTKDVDLIIEVGSRVEYSTTLREQLLEGRYHAHRGQRARLLESLVQVEPTHRSLT